MPLRPQLLTCVLAALTTCGAAAAELPFALDERATYVFYWNHIPVGAATATVLGKDEEGRLQLRVLGRTNAGIDKLYRLRFEATSLVMLPGFQLVRHTLVQKENSRHTKHVLVFDEPNRRFLSTKQKLHRGGKLKHYVIDSSHAYDTIGGFYAFRLQKTVAGSRRAVDVADGKSLYRLTVATGKPSVVKVKAGAFRAVPLVVKLKRISPPDKPKERRPVTTVWLTDDAQRLPVKMSVKTQWGTVWGELMSAKPAPKTATAE